MSRIAPDIRRGRLSGDEETQIVALAERGLNAGQIALRLNRHPGTVNFAMHRLGCRALTAKSFSYFRNGVEVRSFTQEEDSFITALRVQNYPTTKIAEMVTKRWGHPRTSATINMRLTMLANESL